MTLKKKKIFIKHRSWFSDKNNSLSLIVIKIKKKNKLVSAKLNSSLQKWVHSNQNGCTIKLWEFKWHRNKIVMGNKLQTDFWILSS